MLTKADEGGRGGQAIADDLHFTFCNGMCGLKLKGLFLASYAPFLP